MGSVRGFTLMDLLVAVAVFGILATVAFPNFNHAVDDEAQLSAPQNQIALSHLE